MESVRIEQLLDRYFEAETTLEEEKFLQDYFNGANIPAHLEQYKDMFVYFSESSSEESERNLDLGQNKFYLRWLSVAAMIIFFFGAYTVYQQNETEREEARLAYMETQRALELISSNLNKGTGAIAQLDNFNKGTDAMTQLNTFENTKNKVFNSN